jgi:hypothetical protein
MNRVGPVTEAPDCSVGLRAESQLADSPGAGPTGVLTLRPPPAGELKLPADRLPGEGPVGGGKRGWDGDQGLRQCKSQHGDVTGLSVHCLPFVKEQLKSQPSGMYGCVRLRVLLLDSISKEPACYVPLSLPASCPLASPVKLPNPNPLVKLPGAPLVTLLVRLDPGGLVEVTLAVRCDLDWVKEEAEPNPIFLQGQTH